MSKGKNKLSLDKRFFNYVKAVGLKKELDSVPRDVLFALATNKGYKKTEIWDAIKIMEKDFNIACVYEGSMEYYFLNLSKAELQKMKDDDDWFESLPDHRPLII